MVAALVVGEITYFHFEKGSVKEDASVEKLVETDFKAKHSCKSRGENFRAIRWMDNDRLVIGAEVYPTSDCGREMGYTMGYIVDVATGVIERRLSEHELLNLPGVCTQNLDITH